jgi:hypothetical protein
MRDSSQPRLFHQDHNPQLEKYDSIILNAGETSSYAINVRVHL